MARELHTLDDVHMSAPASMSAYIHVPFCAVRCGYCDFNTYTVRDWGEDISLYTYPDLVRQEIVASHNKLGDGDINLETVFFGGGTPTMLSPDMLVSILDGLRSVFRLSSDAEITCEANPDTVTEDDVYRLADAGFTRMSFGMQSAVPHVLATLDRRHTDGQVRCAVAWARRAGLDVSVDLIYGTPGESDEDWETSVRAALDLDIDHISAYALTIEEGTKMGALVRRGEVTMPHPDVQARRYEIADDLLSQAGYTWYEISNWAREGKECWHNMAYWRGGDWWGYGPGAHSHIAGVRFWNVKHPLRYGRMVKSGILPVDAGELLSEEEKREEAIMLGVRVREGLSLTLDPTSDVQLSRLNTLRDDGLITYTRNDDDVHIYLTRTGRLLADTVIRHLWDVF